jgi:hypothetical protein
MKNGVLNDAARMLRIAAKRCDTVADLDEHCTLANIKTTMIAARRLIAEAVANIDATLARIEPYKR